MLNYILCRGFLHVTTTNRFNITMVFPAQLSEGIFDWDFPGKERLEKQVKVLIGVLSLSGKIGKAFHPFHPPAWKGRRKAGKIISD